MTLGVFDGVYWFLSFFQMVWIVIIDDLLLVYSRLENPIFLCLVKQTGSTDWGWEGFYILVNHFQSRLKTLMFTWVSGKCL